QMRLQRIERPHMLAASVKLSVRNQLLHAHAGQLGQLRASNQLAQVVPRAAFRELNSGDLSLDCLPAKLCRLAVSPSFLEVLVAVPFPFGLLAVYKKLLKPWQRLRIALQLLPQTLLEDLLEGPAGLLLDHFHRLLTNVQAIAPNSVKL